MGYYINPKDMSKEEWLSKNGEIVRPNPDWDNAKADGKLPVCLVDNGLFTAAGVCDSKREQQAFSSPTDPRRKTWFLVPIAELIAVRALPAEFAA